MCFKFLQPNKLDKCLIYTDVATVTVADRGIFTWTKTGNILQCQFTRYKINITSYVSFSSKPVINTDQLLNAHTEVADLHNV